MMLLVMLLMGGVQALAWDTTPDENGLYDGQYGRPTYFPDWEQPNEWDNVQLYLVSARFNDASGPLVENYEVAVYDSNDQLRHCNRSLEKKAEDNHKCVLTVRGAQGEKFHFKVIYGDFDNPTIVDIPGVETTFQSNEIVGSGDDPFLLLVPGPMILNETDTQAPAAKTGVDVIVKRTINAGEWGTICLPFAIPASSMSQAFGTQVQLGNFTGCDVTYEADGETVKQITVKFETATAIEANHPYIIKVEDDVTEITVDNVDIIALGADEVASVDCDEQKVKVGSKWYYFYNSFIGNYENGFVVENQKLFLSGGKFWYSTGKTPMMAFRAYFDFVDVLPEMDGSGARIIMEFDDETTTGVSDVRGKMSDVRGDFYDLQGRRVTQPQRGLFIVNGEKVVIK